MKAENMEMHIEAFRCYKPQPGDVLIIRPANGLRMAEQTMEKLREKLEQYLPQFVQVLVLADSIDIEIIRNGEQQ